VAEQSIWPQYWAVHFLDEMDTLIVSTALHERIPLHRPDGVAKRILLGSKTRPGEWTDLLERASISVAATCWRIPSSRRQRPQITLFVVPSLSLDAALPGHPFRQSASIRATGHS
jgi:hypothetical protein